MAIVSKRRQRVSRVPSTDLVRPADVAWYLTERLAAGGDTGSISAALGEVARAHGMARLAKETGLAREGLYRALSRSGNPSLDTLMRVAAALGVRFSVKVVEAPRVWTALERR